MILANIRFISLMPLEEKLRWYFPYSILLSGLGTLFAIVSWVVAFVVHHVQSRKQDCQTPYLRMEETRDCPITEQSSEKEWQYIQSNIFWWSNSVDILRCRNILISFGDFFFLHILAAKINKFSIIVTVLIYIAERKSNENKLKW